MALTTIELFRVGTKNGGPRFEHFRSGEIAIQARNGADWVLGPQQGGASTLEVPQGLRGTWYRLPQGIFYDNAILYLWNDYPGHWSWEPAQDMLLAGLAPR
jgi:hypothetical protein